MPNYAIGFKAFRVDDNGRLRYLFRTHEGSSLVQLDVWMTAKKKWVREAKGRKYRSGFHFLRTDEHIEKFMKLTKNKYVFVPVHVRNIRPKPHTSVGSWLAQEIRVPRKFAVAGLLTALAKRSTL
jgi:hypothetical protein